jgi:AcrR family transcriptional regulator
MSTPAKPVRGRPLLSQDKIIDTTMGLLQKLPLKELTMRRLAQELGTTPAAMYGYFKNQADLFNAVSARVIQGTDLSGLEAETDWRVILRKWAHAVRKRQLEFPYTAWLVHVNPHTPASWFELTEPQLRALRMAGLSGYELMETSRCFSRVVAGSIFNELVLHSTSWRMERLDADAAMDQLSPAARAELEGIQPYLGDQDNETVFAFTIDCLIRGIESALPQGKADQ